MMNNKVSLRRLKDSINDYKLLEKWYKEEKIYKSFEQRKLNLKEIKEKYYPRTFNDSKVPVFMILYNEKPVGIIQYQLVDEVNKKLYKLKDNNIYEIDIFIGELNLHNLGIGTKSINLIINSLKKEKDINLFVMCPLKSNLNAIRCYEKCGFKIIRSFKTNDTIGNIKEYLLMIKR